MRRLTAALTASAVLVVGYAGLDAADFAPGLLTTRPLPPPPPTETPGTRTLPVVPQPSPSTSFRMPLGSLAAEGAAPSAAGVRRALAQVLDLPALSDAALVVRDGQSGEVLFDRGGTERRIPASTTKLLAAAAVGHVFAPDETLKTQVRQGSTSNEIVLVPGGDTLIAPGAGDRDAVAGRAGLADLANQVVKALEDSGIDEVTLSLDPSYAPGPTRAPTWGADFHRLGIVGAVTMLGLSTERARENHPAPNDPVTSALDAFAALLEKRGISVASRVDPAGATTRTGTPAPSQRVLGSVESAPVRDQLALALTDSDNTLTEVLARQAAFRDGSATGFDDVGAWVVRQVAELGTDTQGVALSDASGLSRENRVTADLLTDVLVLGYDGRHPVLRTALEGMPIAGLTGTLGDRFATDSTADAAGRARAKTGTLTGANSLAGSVVDDDGRLLVYAGLVAGAPTLEARAALDRFVAAIAACGCR
ncbi:MAG TPA: D-alanyl-D-alanine carboxypeptidase/D-alanyl-D-alanine-endopeptidase [Intrasporangium sp.]|uniref:D-alanyl-D-alanine carboxypeptidase/D-alanyl-D-alanine endopeptidase n=1 Tax=Intrasporangium sp. TaxID=1925024 RepID=UPI002B49E6FE|nr:D-alanyl-D-alanine carboxypeptidase/D-alanyl-D-alanine-endopeptidase [Intrasporangium sp.]HKX67133.1 D-alanyl-D-alanine carboxypeptidase/D-alanyl-D-alanine-endopeptidase [Intrasporangium sp.]